jgi:predicted SAM-dependent methyltransferase
MEKKPESVLELGPARGFVLKHLQDSKIPAQGLEVSRHCILTRACDGIAEWDLTETPWPFKDEEFDLCYSVAVLEHIPEHAIDRVADEIRRVSRRGLHGIDFGDHDDGFDKSHCLFRDKIWWTKKLNQAGDDASGIQEVLEKDDLERGDPSPPGPDGLLKINVGSHQRMFHHGWVNVDVLPLEGFADKNRFIYRKMDARGGLPCPNRCADFLYASHFLEHLNPEDGRKFLREAFRIMRPGGVVRIVVPDTRRLAQHYLNGTLGVFDEISDGCAGTPWQSSKLWELLFQGHLALYDLDSLQGELRAAGFQDVRVQAFRKSVSLQLLTETVDLFPELSLFVEAVRHE